MLKENFPDLKYRDIPGLCKAAIVDDMKAHAWSLNPGRYIGLGERPPDDFNFKERLAELNKELEALNAKARGLEERISDNVANILEV